MPERRWRVNGGASPPRHKVPADQLTVRAGQGRGIPRTSDVSAPVSRHRGGARVSGCDRGHRAGNAPVRGEVAKRTAASSVLERTPSFWKICRICVCTVFTVMNIAAAISRFVWPCAISAAPLLGLGEPARERPGRAREVPGAPWPPRAWRRAVRRSPAPGRTTPRRRLAPRPPLVMPLVSNVRPSSNGMGSRSCSASAAAQAAWHPRDRRHAGSWARHLAAVASAHGRPSACPRACSRRRCASARLVCPRAASASISSGRNLTTPGWSRPAPVARRVAGPGAHARPDGRRATRR